MSYSSRSDNGMLQIIDFLKDEFSWNYEESYLDWERKKLFMIQ